MTRTQELLARNVKRFRQERGLSMSALAQRAGLAKQTLSTIEQGLGNPTIETLGVLSEALDIPVRRLLNEWGTPVYVQRKDEAGWILSANWQERLLDEVYGSGYVRTMVFHISRRRSGGRAIGPHASGALHHLYVISGRVRTGPAAEPVELGPGDFARFPSDVPHLLEAITERAVAHVVTTQPQLRQIRD